MTGRMDGMDHFIPTSFTICNFQLRYLPTSLAKHCLDFPLYFQLPYLPTSLAKQCLDFSFAFSAPLPAYRPWAQISNHGRACTQALLLYKRPLLHCTVSTSQFLCVGDRKPKSHLFLFAWQFALFGRFFVCRDSGPSFHLVPFVPLFFFVGCFVLLLPWILCLDSL
jgi:hypothetical protein